MKLYFAGCFSGSGDVVWLKNKIKNKLYSYHNEPKLAREWGSDGLMLDSGAFSAWTKGVSVDIDKLIAFIDELRPEQSIQLDSIGDDEKTWKNYVYMSKKVNCLPVIHYNAVPKHIKRVLDASSYVCLGGLVPLTRKKNELKKWIDYFYSFKKARQVKVHCLGVTTKSILERYPFYSCDSTTALNVHRYPKQEIKERFLQKTKDRTYLSLYEIDKLLKLEQYITDLWAKRGITWDENS